MGISFREIWKGICYIALQKKNMLIFKTKVLSNMWFKLLTDELCTLWKPFPNFGVRKFNF